MVQMSEPDVGNRASLAVVQPQLSNWHDITGIWGLQEFLRGQ